MPGEIASHGLGYDVNCSILFTALDVLERPSAAKDLGFDANEPWWPFHKRFLRTSRSSA